MTGILQNRFYRISEWLSKIEKADQKNLAFEHCLPYGKENIAWRYMDMSMATLTTKGQITIPKDMREELDLHPGDKLDFTVDAHGEMRVTPVSRTVADVFGLLGHKARKKPVSVGQMHSRVAESLQRDWK